MKIKSIEDLKKLFEIIDDKDQIIVSDKDWNQLPGEWWGGTTHVSTPKSDEHGTRWLINYAGKTLLIKLNES